MGKDSLIIFIFKWVFARRNSKFRADYSKYLRLSSRSSNKGVKAYASFFKKYAVPPCDPDISLIDLRSMFTARDNNTWDLQESLKFSSEIAKQKGVYADFEGFSKIASGLWLVNTFGAHLPTVKCLTPNPKNILKVAVNTSAPEAIILEEFARILKEQRNKRGNKRKITRARISEYYNYLKIYDLYKCRKSYIEIAGLIFPNYSLDSAKDRVSKNLRAARELIHKKKYMQIS